MIRGDDSDSREKWVLTDEGRSYSVAGSPEVQLFLAIPPEGISREELQKKVDPSVYKIGCAQVVKNKWVEIGKQLVSRKVQNVDDQVKNLLLKIQAGEVVDQVDIDALKKRKLIALQTWKGYSLQRGPNYTPKRKKAVTDLTREHLQRPTMILYGIDNIRDLFGHKVDLNLIKKNPICRIGLE